MKKIIVFVGQVIGSGKQLVEVMNQYSQDEFVVMCYSDVIVSVHDGTVAMLDVAGRDIFDGVSCVYLRGLSNESLRHVLAAYAASVGVPVINEASYRYEAMSKIEQYVTLALAGVPVPDSVYVQRKDYYQYVPALLGCDMPIVAKSITGKNGKDNVLVSDERELAAVAVDHPVFQPFIPNTFDYRVIVAGGEVILTYKRTRRAETSVYQNNISRGGTAEIVSLPEHLKLMAITAAQAVGRDLAGLDILPSTDGRTNVVLEVNFNFGKPLFNDDDVQEVAYHRKLAAYFSKRATKGDIHD